VVFEKNVYFYLRLPFIECGAGSVVGVATGYGLDGSGIESRWGEIFRTSSDRPWGPPSLLYNGYRVFSGGKERPGRDADSSPPSSAVVKKEQSYTSTPRMGCTACTGPQCLYRGALYLFLLFTECNITRGRLIHSVLLSVYGDYWWVIYGLDGPGSNPSGDEIFRPSRPALGPT